MNKKAIEARREYQREWRKKNPEKVKRSQEKFWERKAAEAEQAQRMEPKPQQA